MSLERARVWLSQGRHDLAEDELRASLREDPQDALAHALLSLTLVERDRADEGEQEARLAIAGAPDVALCHYALASSLQARGKLRESEAAIGQALQLDPQDADAWALLAASHFGQRRWAMARTMAERALQIDPEHVGALNLRARALAQEGDGGAAESTLAEALSRDPENAWTHNNRGWTLLQSGAVARAREHFLEALRIDPELEGARVGLIESIKAQNRFYRAMFSFFLWLGRHRKESVWVVLIGLWIAPRLLRRLGESYPAAQPILTPLAVALALFAFLTWIIDPLANLALFLHPIGRHALQARERIGALAVATSLAAALASFGLGIAFAAEGLVFFGIAALLFVIPVSGAFSQENPRYRRIAVAISGVLAALALVAAVLAAGGEAVRSVGLGLLGLYVLGVMGTSFLLNAWSLSPRTD